MTHEGTVAAAAALDGVVRPRYESLPLHTSDKA